MAYTIVKKQNGGAPTLSTSEPSSASASSNQVFGMPDVPESAKQKTYTEEEMKKALANGELCYGPMPEVPSLDAFHDFHFDYCDGLRFKIDDVPADQPKKKYYVHIVATELDVILHSGVVESGAFLCTSNKYYMPMSLTVINQDELSATERDLVRKSYQLNDEQIDFLYNLARLPGCTTGFMLTEFQNKRMEEIDSKLLFAAADYLRSYVENHMTYTHSFDPKGKDVMVQLPVGTIGDSVGWFSYMERFQQKLDCRLICVMNPIISKLFKNQYPQITFIGPKDTVKYKPYAAYKMGLFFKGNTTDQPYDFRYIGNGRTVAKILDVDDTDIAPRVDLSRPRQIKEHYVCIAAQASAYCKLWTNQHGWHTVITHLKELGYRVLCIDKDTSTGTGIAVNHMPWGVEDFTGNRPLQERIDLLKDCDFFIGLSSGVSWLAWCAKCPVVMISGFTNPYNEFYTPYRVINPIACHGCWNDERCEFDHFDYMWCPRHKGTARAYECSTTITPKLVLNVIKKIPEYQAQVEQHRYDVTATQVTEYLTTLSEKTDERVTREDVYQIILMTSEVVHHKCKSDGTDYTISEIATQHGFAESTVAKIIEVFKTTKPTT